jgi:DNA-binding transcriptional LysR family regulator
MSLVQLESFIAVAEEGNVGRAARRLHISQPPLTRRIRSLEEELGTALFARTPKGMTLLPAGSVLLDHAKRVREEIDAATTAVSRFAAAGRTR